MNRTFVLLAFLLTIAFSRSAFAGGPLAVGSAKFGIDGIPFVWDNTKLIQFRTDSGTLGVLSNATANSLLQQQLGQWAGVSTASLNVQYTGTILGVANGHVANTSDFNTVYGSCISGTQSPVIYDADGSLFQQLIGDSSVVGFTTLCDLSSTGHIQAAMMVFTGGAGLNQTQQGQVMLHESGHFFGLDHSLPGLNPCGTAQADLTALPIMWSQLGVRTSLSADDKAWISMLYPSGAFNSVYGTITGQILFSDGVSGLQDALVAAHPAAPASVAGEDRSIAYAAISGYRFTGNPGQSFTANYLACNPASACPHGFYGNNQDGSKLGSRQTALLGWYEIPVPAGSYAVEVSDINDAGTIGPLNPIIPLPAPGEYWNANESAADQDFSSLDCTQPRTIDYVSVKPGIPTNNVNVILNGTPATFDLFEGGSAPSSAASPAQRSYILKPTAGSSR